MNVNYQAFQHQTVISKRLLAAGGLLFMASFAALFVSLFTGFIVIGSVVALLCISGLEYVRKGRFEQFLSDNNWYPEADNIANYIATSLLGVGFYQEIVGGFAGLYDKLPMHAVLYRYKVQRGHDIKAHTFISLCIDITVLLPFILLDSKRNNFLGQSNLPEPIPGSRKLQLEGNFNNTYQVVVMPGTERTVLELMTPDFMHELLSAPPNVDIEMEANQIFFVMRDATFTQQNLEQLFGAVDVLLKHINRINFSWQASISKAALLELTTQALTPRATVLGRPPRVR